MTQYAEKTLGGWRTFFWIATIFNFVIGLIGMITPESTLDGRITGLLVFAFGIMYMQVARDPMRFAPVLWAGVLGKLGVVGLLGPGALASGEMLIIIVLALDLLFAVGFLVFLLTRDEEIAQ